MPDTAIGAATTLPPSILATAAPAIPAARAAALRGLLTLPRSFFAPGQERHLRRAFVNADESTIAEVPRRLG
jgi:aspartate/methionine/tyrosine aminotransferase